MTIHFVGSYVVALGGLALGGVVGLVAMRTASAKLRRIGSWDATATLPLLIAVAAAHLALIPVVEPARQVMFGLYVLSVTGVVVVAVLGWRIWRIGAVLLPLGSIGGYFYFAALVQEADYIGLAVKVVELAAIACALMPVLRRSRRSEIRPTAA